MSTLQLIGTGFATVLTPMGIMLMFVGVAVGIVFGALPGLSATMAIALFLPVTYAMSSSDAMTLLMALFIGAISGGLSLDGGTLRTTASFTSARNVAINAGGGMVQLQAILGHSTLDMTRK